jgi:myo-inositol-1(or 4)-monophosphatase
MLIEEAAFQAGAIALKHFRKDPEVWYKGHGRSPVSEADIEIDQFLKSTLLELRPNYGWLSEEIEDDLSRLNKDLVFVVDPIDGTRAFIAGTDQWCVSIAIVAGGRPIHGVLYAPVQNILYKASRNMGCFIDGNSISKTMAGDIERLNHVIVPHEVSKNVDVEFDRSITRIDGSRSLALRLAGLAESKADGIFVRKNSRDWDMAAADIIIQEAGFKLQDSDRKDVVYNTPDVEHGLLFATSPSYIAGMINALKTAK